MEYKQSRVIFLRGTISHQRFMNKTSALVAFRRLAHTLECCCCSVNTNVRGLLIEMKNGVLRLKLLVPDDESIYILTSSDFKYFLSIVYYIVDKF